MQENIVVRNFEPEDQSAARQLILEGLGGHFGFIDETLNPDLDDIAITFREGCFLVATIDDRIVGTGALKPAGAGTVQIVRMSTSANHRRLGIGSAVVRALIARARDLEARTIVLGTDATWDDAIAFYPASGFMRVDDGSGPAIFRMDL